MMQKRRKKNLFEIYNFFILFKLKVFKTIMLNLNFLFIVLVHEDELISLRITFRFFQNSRIMEYNNTYFINIYLSKNNIISFNKNIHNRFNLLSNKSFLIGIVKTNKLYWTNFSYLPFKFFLKLKPLFSHNYVLSSKNDITELKKNSILRNYIYLKKRTGFLKKKDKLKYYSLVRTNSLRNYKYFTHVRKSQHNRIHNDNFIFTSINSFNFQKPKKKDINFGKYIDLRRKSFKLFNVNRFIFKNFFFLKKNRQYQLTKFFSKITKFNYFNTIMMFELSLYNLLVRAKFVITFEESLFLIRNRLVFVNGMVVTNPWRIISPSDIVSISISNKFYNFFKFNFNSKLKLTFSLGYRLWRLNRFKNNFYKQPSTRIPDYINKLIFFYEDAPSFLEIDYTILSFCLLKFPINHNLYNFYFLKFVNLFMLRTYNWKRLT